MCFVYDELADVSLMHGPENQSLLRQQLFLHRDAIETFDPPCAYKVIAEDGVKVRQGID